jgi:hypothetical protein
MSETERERKLFTIEEARALLPRILPEVEDLLATFAEIRAEIESTAKRTGLPGDSPDLAGHLESRGVLPRLFEKVTTAIDSIQRHGCLVNGPEAGLVDFPCLYDREIVFLCWKFGESGITHWHRITDGFAGRRPLLDVGDETVPGPVH